MIMLANWRLTKPLFDNEDISYSGWLIKDAITVTLTQWCKSLNRGYCLHLHELLFALLLEMSLQQSQLQIAGWLEMLIWRRSTKVLNGINVCWEHCESFMYLYAIGRIVDWIESDRYLRNTLCDIDIDVMCRIENAMMKNKHTIHVNTIIIFNNGNLIKLWCWVNSNSDVDIRLSNLSRIMLFVLTEMRQLF